MRRSMDVDTQVCVSVTLALATLFTIARFWARSITKVKLWVDDWFGLAAYTTAAIFSVLTIAWTLYGGLGQELATLDTSAEEANRRSSISILAIELLYAFSLFSSKCAILGMYWRLFSTSHIRIPIQVLAVVSLIWVIIRTFMTIFHCVPPQAFWDKTIENPRCDIDNSKFFFGTTLTHLLIDVAILILPAIEVRQLKLRRAQKLGVICLFMFGAVVCVAAIVLLVSATKLDSHSSEMPYDLVTIMIPATIEVNFSVVSACLPTIRPVIQRLIPNIGLSSNGRSNSNGTYARNGGASNAGVRTGTSVKLRTLTTNKVIELDDDSSTKNFSDQNYGSGRTFVDVETGSLSSSDEDRLRHGPKTTIQAAGNGSTVGSARAGGGIHVKNETSISYETRGDKN